jgi:hypothetical protein
MGHGMTIEEFIEARISERETAANEALELEQPLEDKFEYHYQWRRFLRRPSLPRWFRALSVPGAPSPREVLRQCAAVRELLNVASDVDALYSIAAEDAADSIRRTIAAIWDDHPDYLQEWSV